MNSNGADNLFPTNSDNQPPQSTAESRPNDGFASADTFQSKFDDESAADNDQPMADPMEANATPEIHWSASEAPEHEHGAKWKMTIIIITLVVVLGLAALTIFKILPLVTSISAGVLAVLMMIAMFVVAKKPSRDINYTLTEQGIAIDGQLHPFVEFQAYGIREIGALWELVLIPVKRFGLGYTAFIQEDQGEAIVDALGAHLPMEKIESTWIDKLARAMKL